MSTVGSRRDNVVNGWSRRFVKVAPPTVYAGVGNALRNAFTLEGEIRSMNPFEDLLARIDQADSTADCLKS